ncbi:hypothetical protein DFH28DRAFT_970501 [Melampsora americana]|nr:hypothetical protein DFH28DRAFT_970501 [Melampsora americana]
MLSQSIIAVLLLASSPEVFTQKVDAPANIPECSTKCMTIKLTEAATWFGPGDLASYCTKPQFLVAYNRCIHDHCHGEDLTLGRQAGAAACGTSLDALTAPIPAPGAANSTVTPTGPGLNSTMTLNTTIGGLNSSVSTTTGLNGSSVNTTLGLSHNSTLTNGSSLNPINSTMNSTSRFSNNASAQADAASSASNSKTDLFFASSIALFLSSLLL